jgi:putative oxidoreductase
MRGVLDWRGHAAVALAARLYLAGIFLWACLHKIAEPRSFAIDVATYEILPLWAVNAVALWLPWVELAAALSLALGLRVRAGAWLVCGMMVVFLAAIGAALARGMDLSCGCFASQGAAEDPISWRTVVRDLFWLLLAVYVLVFDARPLGLDRWLSTGEARHAASA